MSGERMTLRTAEERELWKAAAIAGKLDPDTVIHAYRLRTPAPALPGPRELEDALAKVCAPLSRYLPRGFPRPEHLAAQVIDIMGGEAPKGGE